MVEVERPVPGVTGAIEAALAGEVLVFDAMLRRLIDPPLAVVAKGLAASGLGANSVTLFGAALAVAAAAAIAAHELAWAAGLIAANRLFDGLDGAIARQRGATDFGAYLDIVCDYVFYAAIPFGFALADPERNAIAAAALLASFCLTCASYLAFAALAAKRGETTSARGKKSYYASFGLIEGAETIAFFFAFTFWPAYFSVLAFVLASLCIVTAGARVAFAARELG